VKKIKGRRAHNPVLLCEYERALGAESRSYCGNVNLPGIELADFANGKVRKDDVTCHVGQSH